MPFTWYESVPSGLRWFCDDCSAHTDDGHEMEADAEIEARIIHKPSCAARAPTTTEEA